MLPSCRFGVEVSAARWDEDRCVWHLETASGQRLEAAAVISAIGMFNDIAVPDIDGLDTFQGTLFHTARWQDDHDLTGERVAIVGSAASAVQTIPEIAPIVAELDVYQRTPQWVLPKADDPFTEAELARFRDEPEAMAEHRQTLYEQLEAAILFDDEEMLAESEAAGLRNLALVRDPALRRRLTPSMRYGCRRPLLSNKYYPTFNRDNVSLVDCGISRIVPEGIIGGDGKLRPVDTIILATGFETTRFVSAIDLVGRGGLHIDDAWRDGAQAYLGMVTSGFPNLFMIYGPNTNNGSLIYMLELEVAYIVRQLLRMRREGADWIDVRRDVMDAYNEQLQRDIAGVDVWAGDCGGYYRAGSGRVVTQLPYNMTRWRQMTTCQDGDAYDSGRCQPAATQTG
jgi:cation diffusion facilitator CzcD-associated flavoprotein CzcO